MLHNLTGKLEMDNELDLELKYYIDTYFFLQLCKKLRQPTWKKQILEFSQQYGKVDSSQEVHGKVNSVQKLNSFTSPNNLFILNPELQALMYVNSMIRDLHYLNDLTLQQQLDIDWFYLSLLQRWLKKYTNSQLVKNIASKFQSHLDTIDKMIEILGKTSKENQIPVSAFEEIFRDSGKTAGLLNLLRADKNSKLQSENIEESRKRFKR